MRLHVHLISDSTGETVVTVARAAVSQFEDVVPVEHVWFFVRTRQQLEKVLVIVEAPWPGHLHAGLARAAPCPAGALPRAERALRAGAGQRDERPGRAAGLRRPAADRPAACAGRGLLCRIAAIDYAMRHDDGQAYDDLEAADVVLVGVSRTSKTPPASTSPTAASRRPTCRSCANRPSSITLATLQRRPLIVGLTINPESLAHIRRTRQRMLGLEQGDEARFGGDYADIGPHPQRAGLARRLFARHKWPEIDVTKRSVEETAANLSNGSGAAAAELKALAADLPNAGWAGDSVKVRPSLPGCTWSPRLEPRAP